VPAVHPDSIQVQHPVFVVLLQDLAPDLRPVTEIDEDAGRQLEKSVREHARLRHGVAARKAGDSEGQRQQQQHHPAPSGAGNGRLHAGSDESVRTQERGRSVSLLKDELADAMADAAAGWPNGTLENVGSWALLRSGQVGFWLQLQQFKEAK